MVDTLTEIFFDGAVLLDKINIRDSTRVRTKATGGVDRS